MENVIRDWLDTISPDFRRTIVSVIQQTCGKRGCLLLKGVPGAGKTIVIKLIASLYNKDEIGIFSRQEETKFWLQDLVNKKLWIAEEMTLTDEQADLFKSLADGSQYVSTEIKNRGRQWLTRVPLIVTSNFPITCMCPRQHKSVMERCNLFEMTQPIAQEHAINKVHSMTSDELNKVVYKALFKSSQ